MTSVISTTYDDKYFYFTPLVVWCWNRLGVNVVCFVPQMKFNGEQNKIDLINRTISEQQLNIQLYSFVAPQHKEATAAQCVRLYAACLDLPEDEVLVVSDIDMIVFNLPNEVRNPNGMTIFGADLVPYKQFPMCYLSGTVRDWRNIIGEGTYQEHLDKLLGHEECEHFRGNMWGRDQETAHNLISKANHTKINRARPGTQFASNRLDRDDAYLLDRLSLDIVDYHLPRPGYEENNFNQIMTVLKYFYPNDDLSWIERYRTEYLKLL